ncbi:MAG: FecR family protein [Elusimicrobiota bacterium]|nr:FecR family protein [Elusimicrobiota bacterium]
MKYLMMACLMAAGAGTAFAEEPVEAFTAKLFTAKGTVETLKAGTTTWLTIKAPYLLEINDQVRTGLKSKAELYIKYGSKIRLAAETTFVVNRVAPEENSVEVIRGKMQAWIRKFVGRSFSVRTPAAVCAVRGTVFEVEVADTGETAWSLFSGAIQVIDNRNRAVDMAPNQRLEVTQAEGAAVVMPLPPEVKAPDEPKTIKEEKIEIKAEKVILETKAKEEAAAAALVPAEEVKEEVKEETAAPIEEPIIIVPVVEPPPSVIPTQEVKESQEVSGSTP